MHSGHLGVIRRYICPCTMFEQGFHYLDPIHFCILLLPLGHVATEAGDHKWRELEHVFFIDLLRRSLAISLDHFAEELDYLGVSILCRQMQSAILLRIVVH